MKKKKDTYPTRLRKQRNRCAICQEFPHDADGKNNYRRLCQDHDHKNGKDRSLLCSRCNSMLGYARDNPSILSRASDYLIYWWWNHTEIPSENENVCVLGDPMTQSGEDNTKV